MKKLILLFTLVLGLAWNMNAQTEKTLVKSVALEATTEAVIALPGDVTVTEWDKSFIRVTTTLNVLNFDENITKRLVIVGRYSLLSLEKEGKLYITMPKVNTYVSIKGVDLKEDLKFQISAPKDYKVVIKNNIQVDTNISTTSL